MSKDLPRAPPELDVLATADAQISFDPRRSLATEVHPRRSDQSPPPGMPGTSETETFPVPSSESTFLLREEVGKGGFGEVWSAVQGSLSRLVAVKKLRSDVLESTTNTDLLHNVFRQEALTAAYLEHPNIVPVYQLGSDADGQPLLAMKLVKGSLWSELIQSDHELEPQRFYQKHLPILIHVARAVAFAHSRGIVHRDLKPSQVMVGEFGEVLLMDWGLALVYDEARALGGALDPDVLPDTSSASTPAGTPGFMAPEQTHRTPANIGPWTDCYLLGATLYFLLARRAPHDVGNAQEAFQHASKGTVQSPREVASAASPPRQLEELALWALRPEPSERIPSIDIFIETLEAYLDLISRQRDSRRITASVLEQLSTPASRSYADLAATSERLDEATGLWPENPDLFELKGKVADEYTRAALERQDLALAGLQAARHPDRDQRRQLVGRTEKAIVLRNRQARQRRVALLSSFILVLAMIGGTLKYLRDQRAAATELRTQRDLARQERSHAEGLVGFMLDDLWAKLQPLARSDLLEPVARQAISYYSDRQQADSTDAERRQRGAALAAIGEVFRDRGDLEQAETAFTAAAALYQQLVGSHSSLRSTPIEPIELLYSTLTTIGAVQGDRGETKAAHQTLDTLRRRCELAIREGAHVIHHRRYLATALDHLGIVEFDSGALADAEQTFGQGITQLELVFNETSDPDDQLDLVNLLLHRAITSSDLGRPDHASDDFERASKILEDAIEREPTDQTIRLQRSFLQFSRAESLADSGQHRRAVVELRASLGFLEQLVEQDPENIEHRYSLAMVHLELGRSLSKIQRHEEARAEWNRVLALSDVEGEQLYLKDTRLRALVHLGLLDQARQIARFLAAKGWTHLGFPELAEKLGVAVDDPS